ncbi:phosphatidylinositol-specific phospholipase-like protein [Leptomonas seymouri]|uniref:Phosphoinositide phospholipase C n=1 Tax=Leptomonas seymouri TaxID=5684 RepID=A0A0N1IKD7_LEPSE|nr:phosphatidylinositol-specific phospholipase-like protein [Leptomonas seymouri]|eukprot:KPI86640.1 phosphatidylinositol-specific phospholipase-like protein [Leptomonas seymouri]
MSASLTGESSWDSNAERSCNDLVNDLHGKGVPMLRITKSYTLKKIIISFSNMGDGLQYQPASDKHSSLLFANMRAIRVLPSSDTVCRRARLHHFQYCLQVKTPFGWSWNLVCSTELDRATWLEFLEQRRRMYLVESRTNVADVSITRYWSTAALCNRSRLSFNEVSALFKSLFGHIPPDEFADRFRLCDSDNDTFLDFEEFRTLFLFFNQVDLIEQVYAAETENAQKGMSAQEFTRFCIENDGGSNMTPMRCAALFYLLTNRQAERLNLTVFTAFLLHPLHNSVIDQRQLRVVDSMDLPLNHYYISSSHNTYLLGNQLSSESSCSMYRNVLHAGCRCVEIDCWDGPEGRPIVYHGHTITTKILFEDVIRTINTHAFQNPETEAGTSWNPREFPVILSLEVHTNSEQTNRLAEIMQDVFGDRLFISKNDVSAYTPEKLKGKILVKWKMHATGVEEVKDTTGSGIRPDRQTPLRGRGSVLSACASIGSVTTSTWGAKERPYNVESFTEGTAGRLSILEPANFARQNSRMLTRIYPLGTRIDSSNYDPMPMWRMGCQMVALNWQTRDYFLRINEGFFDHQNGGCGYVLKPPYLREVGSQVQKSPFVLVLRIICGSHLHATFDGVEATHVLLRVWIHGALSPVEMPLIPSVVYPQWNETIKLGGEYKELDMLCLKIVARTASGNSYDVCTSCLPVKVLRCGFHAIPVRHAKGGHVADIASVLCQVRFEKPRASNVGAVGESTPVERVVQPLHRCVF